MHDHLISQKKPFQREMCMHIIMDIWMCSEELKNSLAFESKKSNCHKSVLDQIRVTKISGKR